ncbi:MAG: polysaccharide deacetylase family protein [Candidatus Rokuibacteriota bacterium]
MRTALSAVLLGLTLAVAVLAGAQAPTREPNELGRVMILEYHKIDTPEARWTRTPENFRRDLQRLWERGYRTVALNDYIDGKIALPAGTTPLILTFDDSSPGQFRYIQRGSDWVIDPECGIGILEAFAREHPGFGRAATFYVLPGANPPNRLFNQPDLATRKLQYLVSQGYEIGNHSLWHAELGRYSEAVVREQLAGAQEWVQRHVPGYRFRTLALPLGSYPKELGWALSGEAKGMSYKHDAILMVAGGAAPSPHARNFDANRLPRIQAVGPDLDYWITYFDRNPGERYVSDGDAATVTVASGSTGKVGMIRAARVIERR